MLIKLYVTLKKIFQTINKQGSYTLYKADGMVELIPFFWLNNNISSLNQPMSRLLLVYSESFFGISTSSKCLANANRL